MIRDLQITYGYTPEMASNLVFQGGYKIYTTQNPKYQSIAENVFENTDYVGSTDSNGEQLQAGITVMDPYTGDVVALVDVVAGLAAGAAVTLWPGCPRNLSVCGSRFGNVANFGGLPYLPAKNPFSGDALV